MIAAEGFKRVGVGVAAVLAAGIGALALVPIFIRADHVRDAVQDEIRAVTGLDPVLKGDVAVSLFPTAKVSLGHVILGDDHGGEAALTAERLTARLRLLPLLLGRIEIANVSLARPHIAVMFDVNGRSNWSGLIDTLSRALKPGAKRSDRRLSFSEIRVEDGTIFVRDEKRGITETIADVELSLAWPAISRSFAATGRFLWRNELIDASFSLNDLFAAVMGDRSGLKIRLTGAPLKLAFDGHLSHRPGLKIEGTLAADATSLRQALRWVGYRPLPGNGLGRFALRAQTAMSGASVAFSSVNVELDGNGAEGVLTIGINGRPTLQGTLAADALDLSPYVSTLRLLKQEDREWSGGTIGLDSLTGFDFDLRLSAARIALSSAKLGRSAITASLRSGHMTLAIGESQAFGGMLKGSMSLARTEVGLDLKAQAQFTNVDLESCLSELFGVRRIDGKGNLAFAVEGSGASILALTRTLDGQSHLTARQGAVIGLNLEQLLRRLERRPLSGGGDFRSGRTPFERLTVALKIVQGIATIEDARLEGPAVRLTLGGSASIPTRDLDLKGTASLVTASPSEQAGFELPFVVQGRWDDPILLPDAQILIQRSGAAAPLLDAVRERSTRDAVRSAIEHLTRGLAPEVSNDPAAAPAPPTAAAVPPDPAPLAPSR